MKENVATKILPEAISWHFAGLWDHIDELKLKHNNLSKDLEPSFEKLSKCIALPISTNFNDKFPIFIRKALISAHKNY